MPCWPCHMIVVTKIGKFVVFHVQGSALKRQVQYISEKKVIVTKEKINL